MACSPSILVFTFVFLSWLATPSCSWGTRQRDGYVKDACSVTRYQDLCIDSLSSYSKTAKTDPSKWARAGVSVTIGETKNVTCYLVGLKKNNHMKGRNRVAVLDCVDVFQDALDRLHQSLGVLRRLNAETFDTEMQDITTWISSALTDEDTCLDGFEGQDSHEIKSLESKVKRSSYFTSNALALVAKLASSGP
ncbi:pectinesterase inhibitor 6-like [Rutidosis leptorrhynchoides]|uniref:pectinesterase inhibitor 6-like n=1 Tax=Rutidosis leptorrhynchoides TaxID=125765 RepID=UPI003A9998A1